MKAEILILVSYKEKEYYKLLYTKKLHHLHKMDKFLKTYKLPKITTE
jgi:hypothetical protein